MTWVEWITLIALFLGVGVYSFILGWNKGLAHAEKWWDDCPPIKPNDSYWVKMTYVPGGPGKVACPDEEENR